MKKISLFAVSALLALFFATCDSGGDGGSGIENVNFVAVTDIGNVPTTATVGASLPYPAL